MLRDDKQLALNDLVVAVQEAADRHERSAELTDDAALSAFFARLARRRRHTAKALGDHLRHMDDLPRSPDEDLETVRDLISGVKAGLSKDKASTLLEESATAEDDIEEALSSAMLVDLPEEVEALIRDLRDDVADTRERLQDLHGEES